MKTAIQFLSLSLLTAIALPLAGCDAEDEDVELRVWVDVPSSLPIFNPDTGREDATILLTLDAVSAHMEDRGWITRRIDGATLELTDPETLPRMLSGMRLPMGVYDKLRFHESSAAVFVDGKKYPLELRNGFTVATTFCIEGRNDIEDLELDWDVEDNLHWNAQTKGYWIETYLVVRSAPDCDDAR